MKARTTRENIAIMIQGCRVMVYFAGPCDTVIQSNSCSLTTGVIMKNSGPCRLSLRVVLLLVASLAAGCGSEPPRPRLTQPATANSVPQATFRITFGINDTREQPWDGYVVVQAGQRLQVEPDLIRDHNYEVGDDPGFPNDYVRASSRWVLSSQRAWMRDRRSFQLEHPSVLVHVLDNAGGSSVQIETVRGDFSFQPADLEPFRPMTFLDGGVRVERVASPVAVAPEQLGQQDYPSILQAVIGKLWIAWQEYRDEADAPYVRSKSADTWGPIIALEEGVDVFRTDMGEDAQGRIWVIWSMQLEGNWDLHGRFYDGTD